MKKETPPAGTNGGRGGEKIASSDKKDHRPSVLHFQELPRSCGWVRIGDMAALLAARSAARAAT
jgi:hypothetical protein